MREKVETYEEAVVIHHEFTESEIAEHNKGVYKKRVAFAAAAMTGASIALGVYSGYPVEATVGMIPAIGLVTGLTYLDYHRFLKEIQAIKDGSFFEGKDEKEIIENANRYIDSYNEHVLGGGK